MKQKGRNCNATIKCNSIQISFTLIEEMNNDA